MRCLLIAALVVVTVAGPLPCAGQSRTAHVAVLSTRDPVQAPGWRLFTEALKDRGWFEGRNLAFSLRVSEGRADRYGPLAAELVALRPDVIVGVTTQAVQALRAHTETIPIVMLGVADPVAAGFATSLARPGGNITGPSTQLTDIQEKSLQLLKEIRPATSSIALLWTPDNAGSRRSMEITVAVSPKFGIALQSVAISTPEDLVNAIAVMTRNPPDALLVHPTPILQVHNQTVVAFVRTRRLPTITSNSQMVREGLLLSYAPDFSEGWRVAAGYVDRILKGAQPAGMPIEQPTKFQFVINLKTARAIGVEIPPLLIFRADEVIE